MNRSLFIFILCSMDALAAWVPAAERDDSAVLRLRGVPEKGVHPRAVADRQGVVHLTFIKGPPGVGNLYYSRLETEDSGFLPSIRVNNDATPVALEGAAGGASLCLDSEGALHAVWAGPIKHGESGLGAAVPIYHARLDRKRHEFTSRREVLRRGIGPEHRLGVAASGARNVYISWTSPVAPGTGPVGARQFALARSTDAGEHFHDLQPAGIPWVQGYYGANSLVVGRGGEVYFCALLQRREGGERSLTLGLSRDNGERFCLTSIRHWENHRAPTKAVSLSLAGEDNRLLIAWENGGQVYFSRFDPRSGRATTPISPPVEHGTLLRTDPVAVSNTVGDILLVWSEPEPASKRKVMVFRLFDKMGRRLDVWGSGIERNGAEAPAPLLDSTTAVASDGGSFTLIDPNLGDNPITSRLRRIVVRGEKGFGR